MKYADIKKYDISNGVGIRVSLFVSGCNHHCKGCFNAEAWDFNYGNDFTDDTITEIIDSLKPDYINGLSLLGGALWWTMFGIVWAVTAVAVVFNCLNVEKFKVVSIFCNLLLGWAALFIMKPLVAACPGNGLALLIWGGVVYSIGAILYVIGKKKTYMHCVFHIFVLFGSIVQLLGIIFYVL